MKNFLIAMSYCVACLMPLDCCAMRTGRTRQETRQLHYIALKEARRQSKLTALLASNQVHGNAQFKIQSMYEIQEYNLANLVKSSSNVQLKHSHSGTNLPTLHRVLLFAFITGMLATPVYANITHDVSNEVLPRVAKIAVSTAQVVSMQMPGVMVAKALIDAVPSVNLGEGILDHTLGKFADQAVWAVQEYHEYEASNPVKAKLALSGCMVLAKMVAGTIAGGLATAPAGGEGAIPGALYGLSKAIIDEVKGNVAGEAVYLTIKVVGETVDPAIGDKLEAFMQRGIDEFASGLLYLDPSLTEQQAKYLSIILAGAALSSAEFTSVVNKLGHLDLNSFKIARGYDLVSVGQASRMSLGKAIREELKPELMGNAKDGFCQGVQDALLRISFEEHASELSSPSEGSTTVDRLFSAQAYQQWKDQSQIIPIVPFQPLQPMWSTEKPCFLATGQEIFQQQAYQQWKAESSSVLHIPPQRPFEMIEHYVPAQPQFFQVSWHGGSGGHSNEIRFSFNFRL